MPRNPLCTASHLHSALRIGYAMVALAALLFAANGPVSIVLIDGGVSARYVVTGRLLGHGGRAADLGRAALSGAAAAVGA